MHSLSGHTHDLVQRAIDGDPDAQASLYKYLEPRLSRFLHSRLSPRARRSMDTEDIVAETIQRAFLKLNSFEYRGVGSFWKFVRRIAINRLVDIHRRNALRDHEEPNAIDPDGAMNPAHSSLADSIEKKEEWELFEAAMKQLPEQCQTSIHLRIEMGLSYEEIALELDLDSASAARKVVHKSMEMLTRLMRARGTSDGGD